MVQDRKVIYALSNSAVYDDFDCCETCSAQLPRDLYYFVLRWSQCNTDNNQLIGDRVHSTDTYTRYGMLFDLRTDYLHILIFRKKIAVYAFRSAVLNIVSHQ